MNSFHYRLDFDIPGNLDILGGITAGVFFLSILFVLAVAVFSIVIMWRIFEKRANTAGRPLFLFIRIMYYSR